MKKLLIGLMIISGTLSSNVYAKSVEQTICFSANQCGGPGAFGQLGDGVHLCGGKCQGRTLGAMNRSGWKLIQVVNGLDSAFGMVFIKEK